MRSDVRRWGERARPASGGHSADHPGQPEAAGGVPVEVVADHVPAAPPAHHAPRLEPAGLRRVVLGRAVVEADLPPLPGRRLQRLERRVDRDHRLDAEGGLRVDLDAGGAQLEQARGRRRGQARVLPEPGGDADRGGLVGLEVDVGQRVVAAGDAVAGLGVEDAGRPGLQRHAEVAQLGLVPFELALERLVLARVVGVVLVPGHGRGDLRGGQKPPRREQADHQIDQTLGPVARHAPDASSVGR